MIKTILLLAALLLHGCATAPTTPTATNDVGPIVFLDTSGFDHALSRQLASEKTAVNVDVPASFNLNKVPDRMAKWFSEVQENGGTIKAKKVVKAGDPAATQSMLAIVLDLTFSIIREVKERAMFAPAEKYDVLLKYEGNGEVKEVVFIRR